MNPFDTALTTLRKRGMCKDLLQDADGHVCARGALNVALHGEALVYNYTEPEHLFLNGIARDLFPERSPYGPNAAQVNNHPDTTQEDVELILKHAAHKWDILHPEEGP